ncbi:MAG: PaaI family thioesterase [Pseudomonadota bacterium]
MTYLLSDAAISPEAVNARNAGTLPSHMGLVLTALTREGAAGYIDIGSQHMAPNGFLHAGTLVTLADSLCGMACSASLKGTAAGFTTIELKSNFFATASDGRIEGHATPVHLGGTTQVWDAAVTHRETGKRLALFRCTQLVLKPR